MASVKGKVMTAQSGEKRFGSVPLVTGYTWPVVKRESLVCVGEERPENTAY